MRLLAGISGLTASRLSSPAWVAVKGTAGWQLLGQGQMLGLSEALLARCFLPEHEAGMQECCLCLVAASTVLENEEQNQLKSYHL